MEKSSDFKEKIGKQNFSEAKKKQLHYNSKNAISKENTTTADTKKVFKNPTLQPDDTIDATDSFQSSLKNLKISVDASKVVSQELVTHKGVRWSELGVSSSTSKILESCGFNFPSPVQFKSVPEILKGHDVLVRAKNGTGKTLSFIIPMIERIDTTKNTVQAIVLVPIRELALQIAKIARALSKELNIKGTPLVGGSVLSDDIIRVSSGIHFLIGTPGRIIDLLERNLCKIESNTLIIFDEADKLLDSIFFESIYKLLSIVPQKRQICLYSATFPVSTKSFINMNMNNPKLIKVSEEYTLYNISLFYAKVTNATKLPCLKSLLFSLNIEQCIIYCNHIDAAQNLAEKITEMGFSCYFIHSKMLQDERNTVFHNFSKNKCKILVSTDLTTRGTDVKDVNFVINFDVPLSSESFLHRQGRAGRFGVKGCCITLIRENETEIIERFADFVSSPIFPCSDPSFKNFCKN